MNKLRYERELNASTADYLNLSGGNDPMEGGLHITRVAVNVGGKIYVIDSKGVQIREGEATGRGVSLYTEFTDENGLAADCTNGYIRQEQFDKGQVLTKVERAFIKDKPQDIWRD